MIRRSGFLIMLILLVSGIYSQDYIPEYKDALNQLINKAYNGDAKSIFELARLYDRGFESIPIDTVKSNELYLIAANKGYAPAQNFIGFRYYKGEGVKHDLDSALYWIRLAADAGDATAAANLGYLLTESHELPYDEKEAVKWLTVASEAGIPGAQFKLVALMEDNWKELSVDSVLNLGLHYYIGQAPIVGVKLLEIASEKGSSQATALLGDAYSKGIGVTYDHNKSIDYFYKAAVDGNPSAQFVIAETLEIFPDVIEMNNKEFKNPAFWYEKAAQQGVVNSETAEQRLFSIPLTSE